MRSSFSKLLAQLCLILTLLSLSGCFIYYSDNDDDDDHNREQVRVISYNLRYAESDLDQWQERKDILIDSLQHYAPDIIGVQEADSPWMQELPRQLSDYAFVGVGRDDGVTAGEYAAIFYRRDLYDVLQSGTFWLSDTPEEPSFGWGATNRRICTWAVLRDRQDGRVFAVYNTHFDHQSEEARINSTALILDRIARSPYPVIMTGDFNFLENTRNYDRIVASALADTKFSAEETMSHGTVNFFEDIDNGLVIDFIFADEDEFDVTRYKVDSSYLFGDTPVSDHYPVISDLRPRF